MLTIENLAISSVRTYGANARTHSAEQVEQLVAPIREFGFVNPVLVDERNELIAGHGRLLAAQQLGMTEVPAIRLAGLSDGQKKALRIADNRLAENAAWDPETLSAEMKAIAEAEGPLEVIGFSDDYMEALLAGNMGALEEIEREEARSVLARPREVQRPDAAPDPGAQVDRGAELAKKWGTAVGQLWSIPSATVTGKTHRILCGDSEGLAHRVLVGDCRSPEDVGRLLGGRRINVAFTSPPYASQRRYDQASDFEPIPPARYVDWFEAVQAGVGAHLAPDGSLFVNIRAHADAGERDLYVYDLVLAHVRRWGWRLIDDLVWLRAGVPGSWPNRFKNGWEGIYHFARQTDIKFRPDAVSHETEHAFDYSPDNGKSVSGSGLLGRDHAGGFRAGLARPSNVLSVGTGGSRVTGLHPAEFPVGLPEFFLRAYSDPGDVVYDPFLGSGTTLVAAERTGRVARCVEISPKYVAVALERLAEMGLQPRLVK